MPRYLIDVNVPRDPSIWPADIAVYAIDLGPKWSDTKLWAHALDYDMTIVTKDADFSNRLMAAQRAADHSSESRQHAARRVSGLHQATMATHSRVERASTVGPGLP